MPLLYKPAMRENDFKLVILFCLIFVLQDAGFGVLASTKSSTTTSSGRNNKIRTSTHPNAGKQCPFFDGIYTSVMRRIFNQGFHK